MARKSGKKGKTKPAGKSFFTKVITAALLITLVIAGSSVYFFLRASRAPNTKLLPDAEPYLFIPSGSTYADVLHLLKEKHILLNTETFDWLARQKNYPRHVYPGKYRLKDGMSNTELIHMLRSGQQEEVQLSINNLRTKADLISLVCSKLEADSQQLRMLLQNDHFLAAHGFHSDNVTAMFIENTYSFVWNTSAEKFFNRMLQEYKKFWSTARLQQAKKQGLSPFEAIILASIVEKESNYLPERPRIASVYLNRLRRNMKLQADPTVIYACGDFTISRVLQKHLEKDSPYNTYKYEGLPPGPICIPSQDAIRSVLEADFTNYLYFCAKEDFSGKHHFAATSAQHLTNAGKYRKALNKKKIFK
ncbi:MAG: endolytic transglycosylase MltG [Bacteroidota bacterium]